MGLKGGKQVPDFCRVKGWGRAVSWRPKDLRKTRVNSLPHFFFLQRICKRCYRGNLISIHSYNFNYRIQCLTSGINQGQIWIGGIIRGRVSEDQLDVLSDCFKE